MKVSISNIPDLDILKQLIPQQFKRVQAASYSKEYIFEAPAVKVSQINGVMNALHAALSDKFGQRFLSAFITREDAHNSLVVILRTPLQVVS